ncbi:hypothetical protein A2635_04685 [Candidatus Peribacteria bacterium RIFCSPHIGHO2_01_FULL_51_9]|nr:MAG: hypothetical protein A2635_04685 [Candidatus Peribacteria bacterium RIFCSPHIGHO2_01_FULL_51_9]
MIAVLQQFWHVPFSLFAEQPLLRIVQVSLLALGLFEVFVLFWTTRDVLLRSESLLFQFFSLAMVAVLPVVGFLFYLLIRPSRTLREQHFEQMLTELLRSHKKGERDRQRMKKDSKPLREEVSPVVIHQEEALTEFTLPIP